MLSCDHCNDWFHYDCIGLQPPGDNENDDEVAPAEYRCPKCCIQVGYAKEFSGLEIAFLNFFLFGCVQLFLDTVMIAFSVNTTSATCLHAQGNARVVPC